MKSRNDGDRLNDILVAIVAIESYMSSGLLTDGLVFDAVRMRLMEICESVRLIDPKLLDNEPEVSWVDIVKMFDKLVHYHSDTSVIIMDAIIAVDLPVIKAAVLRLKAHIAL